jgi:hypothetical protein
MVLFTTEQTAYLTGLNERTLRRYIDKFPNLIQKEKNKLLFTSEFIVEVGIGEHLRTTADNLRTTADNADNPANFDFSTFKKGDILEQYTPEEYEIVKNRLNDYNAKLNQIKHLDSIIEQLTKDKEYLQNELSETRKTLTQSQYIFARFLENK